MSLRVQKGRYYVIDYWDRDKGEHIQEYIGSDKARALRRLIEVLKEKVGYYQKKLDEAERELDQLE